MTETSLRSEFLSFHKTQMYFEMSVIGHIIYWQSLQNIIQTTNTRITLRAPRSTVFFINETQPDKVSKKLEDLNTNKAIEIFWYFIKTCKYRGISFKKYANIRLYI